MNLAPLLRTKFTDQNNNPLSGGKLYSYQSGTTTPQVTYTDSSGGTPNANPVIMDANGEADIWLDPTLSYKFVLKDSAGVDRFTTDNVVGALAPDTVLTVSLQDSAVTTPKLAANAVTSAKLSSSASIDLSRAVTTDHIRDSAVTTAKIADNAVTTAKIPDNAVTFAKLPARTTGATVSVGGLAISSSSGSAGTTSGSFGAVPNLSVTITTSGRPVHIGLVSDGSGNESYIGSQSGSQAGAVIRLLRSGTEIARHQLAGNSGVTILFCPSSVVQAIDTPTSGSYTYTAEYRSATGGDTAFVHYSALIAYEL